MTNYNVWEKRGKQGSDRFDKKKDFGHDRGDFRDRGFDKPKFQAVCAKCGERCEVPFKPMSGKPVYCNNCFRRDERPGADRPFQHGHDDRSQRDNRFDARPHDNRNDFEQLNRKLDTIIELLKTIKAQPPKETKVHVVTTEAQSVEPKEEQTETQTVEPKATKKKLTKTTTAKPDKKKK